VRLLSGISQGGGHTLQAIPNPFSPVPRFAAADLVLDSARQVSLGEALQQLAAGVSNMSATGGARPAQLVCTHRDDDPRLR
jgi:hypothetical protein